MSEQHKTKLFLSYGRRDAAELANRLRGDLEKLGYEVWQDTREIRAGQEWEEQIADGLRSTQVVIALLSPHAVRRASDPNSPDNVDSVCLDELTFARFAAPPTPIVPVMAIPCEPPFPVFRLDYVSMTQWMHSEDEYQRGFERLAAGIEAAATGKPLPTRRWHHCLPVLDFAAQLHEKRRDFVGRQWLFDEIDAWRASSSRERALLVVGDPGIGKSAFVAEMIHRNPDGQVLAYHICRADDPETLRPSTFVMSLAGMIAGRLPAFADLLESPQFQELFDPKTVSSRPAHVFDQGLIAALHQLPAPTDGIRFVLIDALDEALTLGEGQLNIVSLLSTRLDRLPAWLRIVATTRREPNVLNKLSSLRAAAIDAHRQDNLDDIDRYIEARLQTPNLAERLVASRVPLISVQRKLRDKADGNFLYVSQALQDIERDNYSFSRLDELPQGLNQWYEAWFARKFPNPKVDFVDARKVLEVISASFEPLAAIELADASELDSDYSFPEVIGSLRPYVTNLNGKYGIYHKSLSEWLVSAEGHSVYFVNPRVGHSRLANSGIRAFHRNVSLLSQYLIHFLEDHCRESKKQDYLQLLHANEEYLLARAKFFLSKSDWTTAKSLLLKLQERTRNLLSLNPIEIRYTELAYRSAKFLSDANFMLNSYEDAIINVDESAVELRKLIARHPENIDYRMDLIEVFSMGGRNRSWANSWTALNYFDDAITAATELVDMDRNNFSYQRILANLFVDAATFGASAMADSSVYDMYLDRGKTVFRILHMEQVELAPDVAKIML